MMHFLSRPFIAIATLALSACGQTDSNMKIPAPPPELDLNGGAKVSSESFGRLAMMSERVKDQYADKYPELSPRTVTIENTADFDAVTAYFSSELAQLGFEPISGLEESFDSIHPHLETLRTAGWAKGDRAVIFYGYDVRTNNEEYIAAMIATNIKPARVGDPWR